jgi:hypothetical protein
LRRLQNLGDRGQHAGDDEGEDGQAVDVEP